MEADISVQGGTPSIDEDLKRDIPFNPKPSMVLKISVVLVPLMTFCVKNWFVIAVALLGSNIHPVQIAELVGSLIGIILFPAIVVGLFQIGKRFRNVRSRYRIFLYTALFLFFCNLFVGMASFLEKARSI